MKKILLFNFLILLFCSGCMHSPKYQYREKRTPIENCKYLKNQIIEENEINSNMSDANYIIEDANILPITVGTQADKFAVKANAQKPSPPPVYIPIKPKTFASTRGQKAIKNSKIEKNRRKSEQKIKIAPPSTNNPSSNDALSIVGSKEVSAKSPMQTLSNSDATKKLPPSINSELVNLEQTNPINQVDSNISGAASTLQLENHPLPPSLPPTDLQQTSPIIGPDSDVNQFLSNLVKDSQRKNIKPDFPAGIEANDNTKTMPTIPN